MNGPDGNHIVVILAEGQYGEVDGVGTHQDKSGA